MPAIGAPNSEKEKKKMLGLFLQVIDYHRQFSLTGQLDVKINMFFYVPLTPPSFFVIFLIQFNFIDRNN